MTQAVCIFCGCRKFDAFSVCDNCATQPNDEGQCAKSILLTDSFHSLKELDGIGEHISLGGTCHYAPNFVEVLVKAIRKIGVENLGNKPLFFPDWKREFFRGTQAVQTFRSCNRDSLQRYARRVNAGELTISAEIKTSTDGSEGRLLALSSFDIDELEKTYWQGHYCEKGFSEVYKADTAEELSEFREDYNNDDEDRYTILYPVDFLEQHVRERDGWLKDGYYEVSNAKELANGILRRPTWELVIYDARAGVGKIIVENSPMILRKMIIEEEGYAYLGWASERFELAFTMFSGGVRMIQTV